MEASLGRREIQNLLNALIEVGGGKQSDYIGQGKLSATQARFTPKGGDFVIFGQSGVSPHSHSEAHYIPSIIPYYKTLLKISRR